MRCAQNVVYGDVAKMASDVMAWLRWLKEFQNISSPVARLRQPNFLAA
jgi:tRNA threonylcarbamoyladenosine modification (KEOPS) complex  Pcc1 subunit